jgi:hypothetical protein
MHEKSDKLSLIKLNFIHRTSFFFMCKHAKRVVTYKILKIAQKYGDQLSPKELTQIKKTSCHYKILEITQMYGISFHI